jgi:membrane associated rhomboid family serine protease
MNKGFVSGFGKFILIFAIIVSLSAFYFLDILESIFVGIVSVISGFLFYWFYSKPKKITKLISSSVIIGIVATLIMVIFLIWTFISFNNPNIESYAFLIIFSVGLIISGFIYGVSLLLLIVHWFLMKYKK